MLMQIPQVLDTPLPPCPRCGKQSLVKSTNEDVYTCLNCSFRKDVNESWDNSAFFGVIALASMAIIFFSIMSASSSIEQYRVPQTDDLQFRNNARQKKLDQQEKNPSSPPRNTKPATQPIS